MKFFLVLSLLFFSFQNFLNISLTGQFVPVLLGSSIPSKIYSYAYGDGIIGGVTGVSASFGVRILDTSGKPIYKGGETVQVFITPPSNYLFPFQILEKDNGDGSFSFSFDPLVQGIYRIEILLNGENISGSPFFPEFINSSLCILKYDHSGPFIEDCYSKKVNY